MKFWISRNSEIAIHDQLTTQIRIGILSNDLRVGEKLPSTRELARRLKIHSNTVSAAYRELVDLNWLQFRKGSGVYVHSATEKDSAQNGFELDRLISNFLRSANQSGYSLREIQSRLKQVLEIQPPDHFLLIEDDEELRSVLAFEIRSATNFPITVAKSSECDDESLFTGAVIVTVQNQASNLRNTIPAASQMVTLNIRSVPSSLRGEKQPSANSLITVVSRWTKFLESAETILVAAGVDRDCINIRDARNAGWKRGLSSSTIVITDSLTAANLPKDCPTRVFKLISDKSIEELRSSIGFIRENRPE
ncbi:MAG TPA: GntR family transcriptional regulator [Blastocatellia bacterium]|nr:GntR family transcriptional regulator [Blastocatellia bacterium]